MKIGKLTSIDYSQLKVKISSEIRGSSVNLQGNVYYFGNIGSYLKIKNAVSEIIICEVISIFDSDAYKEKLSFDVESNRELLLKPIGNIDKDKKFTLGVGIFPALYSDVSIVTYDDMKIILNIPEDENGNEGNKIHDSFSLGISKNLINYQIKINIDNFFNIHSAVLGNSGSGKSNTIAHIIQEIHKKRDYSAIGSRILVFDVNGEYKQAFTSDSDGDISVKCYKPNIKENTDGYEPFYLPHFLLSLDEWSAFLLATDATQRPFWHKVLQESYRFYKIGTSTDEDQKKLIHYLVNRICEMVSSVLAQADSDTSRITSAVSVINKIEDIIKKDESLKKAIDVKFHDDKIALEYTELNNKNPINKDENVDSTLQGVITGLKQCSKMAYSDNHNKLAEAVSKITNHIDHSRVQKITDEKLNAGEYFDYKFLKIAATMTLLEEDSRGNKQMRNWVSTMLTRLDYFLENPDCKFMRQSENGCKTTEEYIKNFWSQDNQKTQLVIIDTSELSPDILETLTSVVSRLLFDDRRKLVGDDRRKKPIHLILDEAHRYIKKHYEYIIKENIFEKIAREGRKFAFYLLVSSQRPSELSETVLSQCANFIIHRIQNKNDMRYIQAILPYFSEDFAEKIKQSIPGEALVFGNCVSMPLHLKVHKSDPEPNSENCEVSKEWFKDTENSVQS